jgi:hypothetical protein
MAKRKIENEEDISGFIDEDDYCPECGSTETIVIDHELGKIIRYCLRCEEEYEV